jgi:hypothetical protein
LTEFQWYSVTQTATQHYVTYDRRIMLRYFAARHRQREKLGLTRFKFNGVSGGFGHFEYSLTRSARDLVDGDPQPYHGKGARLGPTRFCSPSYPAGCSTTCWAMPPSMTMLAPVM